jgi:hypothetical protein
LPGSVSQSQKTQKKAASLMLSYELYKKNVSAYLDELIVRKALGNNFLNFIYLYHAIYPNLAAQAERDFYDLKIGNMWPVGGKSFKRIASLIGFKNTLHIKKLMRNKNQL